MCKDWLCWRRSSLFVLVALYYLSAHPQPPGLAGSGSARPGQVTRLNPPEEALFIPGEAAASAAADAAASAALPTPGVLVLTATPTATHTGHLYGDRARTHADGLNRHPPPPSHPPRCPNGSSPEGVKYEDQHDRWNYCGPANLTMALTYWGWDGNRDVVGKLSSPATKTRTSCPMRCRILSPTHRRSAAVRLGGEIEVLKRLVADGFPVLIEKGYYERDYTGKMAWMGHYLFVTGYDEAKGVFIVQDTYLEPGENLEVPYDDFINGWRAFNYLFHAWFTHEQTNKPMLTPAGRPCADVDWANRHALDIARFRDRYPNAGSTNFSPGSTKAPAMCTCRNTSMPPSPMTTPSCCMPASGEPNEAETVDDTAPLPHHVVPDRSLLGLFLLRPLPGCDQPGQHHPI